MVTLGDYVKDTVSGFKGIAVSRHIYLQGCDRITIQPKIDKEGKHPEGHTFDEPQLEILKSQKIKLQRPKTFVGGVDKYVDKGR